MNRDHYGDWLVDREPGVYSDQQTFEAGFRAGMVEAERRASADAHPVDMLAASKSSYEQADERAAQVRTDTRNG